jgi:FG-GAP repeat
MNLWNSNFRRERPTRSIAKACRKRPGRSFETSLASLERRALLAVLVAEITSIAPPVPDPSQLSDTPPVPVTTQVLGTSIGIGNSATSYSNGNNNDNSNSATSYSGGNNNGNNYNGIGDSATSYSAGNNNGNNGSGSASGSSTNVGGGSAQGSQEVGPPPSPPHEDRVLNHVALAEAAIEINGVTTPELALVNAGDNKVIVRVGFGVTQQRIVFDDTDGINDPQSVALGDVNGDGTPDLVVANSGDNNVLIFPGLPDGFFGPEVNGGKGIAAGADPVDVTIDDVNHHIIVTNKDSNSVSILSSLGSEADWTTTVTSTIENVGLAPVKTALVDVNQDGEPDLLVCNSESNTVSMYAGQAGGTFDAAAPTIFTVGTTPSDMLIGQFDKRPELDLLTINAGSNDVTFIGGVFTGHPTTQSYPSGGTLPDAAFAFPVTPNTNNKMLDLVVANSGDGHLALFQPANEGMQLAGIITQANLPVPTGLAPATSSGAELDFFAASAGQDAALLLHFELGTASIFLASPLVGSSSQDETSDELTAELMPFGDSGLELIAVLWVGSPDSAATNGEWGLREPSTITALYSPTEGQGSDLGRPDAQVVSNPSSPQTPLPDLSMVASSVWKFVSGIEAAMTEPSRLTDVINVRDLRETTDDRPIEGFARVEPESLNLSSDLDTSLDVIDEALRLFWSEGRPGDPSQPAEFDHRSDSRRGFEGIDSPTLEDPLEAVPLVSSALLLSGRLILKASPPRPPSFRKGHGRTGFSQP